MEQFSLFKTRVKKETSDLIESISKIGKNGDWNEILHLLLSFQASIDSSMEDRFSQVPSDVARIIFGLSPIKAQIALSQTCKRFSSFKWLKESRKTRNIKAFKKFHPLSTDAFVFGVETLNIPWAKIANSLSRPYKWKNSYRIYGRIDKDADLRIDYENERDHGVITGLVIGNIRNDKHLKKTECDIVASCRKRGELQERGQLLVMMDDSIFYKNRFLIAI